VHTERHGLVAAGLRGHTPLEEPFARERHPEQAVWSV